MQQSVHTFGKAVEDLYFESISINDDDEDHCGYTERQIDSMSVTRITVYRQSVYVHLDVCLTHYARRSEMRSTDKVLIYLEYDKYEDEELYEETLTPTVEETLTPTVEYDASNFGFEECVDTSALLPLYHSMMQLYHARCVEENMRLGELLISLTPQDVITHHLLPFIEYKMKDNGELIRI